MPAGGDGFRIPVVLDFSKSIENVRSFRSAVGQAFSDIGQRARSAADAGQPFSPRAVTGALARQVGAAQAAANKAPDLLPTQREELRRFAERQAAAQAAEIRRTPGYEGVRDPTAAQISRSRVAEEKRIDQERAKEARAAQRAAVAAERTAKIEEEKAAKAAATAAVTARANAVAAAAAQTLQAAATRAAAAAQAATARGVPAAGAGGAAGPPAPPGLPGFPPVPGGAIPQGTQFGKAFGIRIPTDKDLDQLRQLLALQKQLLAGGQSNVFTQLGALAGINRGVGLNIGLAETEDPTFRSQENLDLRTQLTVARRLQELEERSEVEQALIRNERQLLTHTAALAKTLEIRQLAQRDAVRGLEDPALDVARARDRLGAERSRARVGTLVAEGTTPDITAELGSFTAANRARIARINAAAARETVANKDYVDATADAALERRKLRRAINEAQQAEIRETGQRGTPIQRLQSYISRRSGGAPREDTDFLTGRQLIASRALTTASFAASGALLYGTLQFARELVSEATALQVELSIVNAQLRDAGDIGGRSFGEIRSEIISISRETGIMGNRVALLTRQLAGAFATPDGTPDFGRALRETESALKLGQVTGLPDKEITDSLTAISLAFERVGADGELIKVPFEQIGDTIIGLEQRFGVLAPEIVKFTADLAPLGAELGFTVTQLSALGAVAQQVSGRSGAVLSEQFGRILPALADRSADLLLLFQENAETARQIPALSQALASRDLPAVLEQLVKGYSNFSSAQQNTLVSLVGSRREAAAFYAILARGEQTLTALNLGPEVFDDSLEERFKDFSETVQFSFAEAQRAIEEFGIILFNAGLADGLVLIGNSLRFVAAGATGLLKIFTELNDATGGWAGKIAGVVAALFILNKTLTITANAYKEVAASQALANLTAGGGFLRRSPVQGPPTPVGLAARGQGPAPIVAGGLSGAGGAVRGFIGANAIGLTALAGGIAFQLRESGKKDLEDGVSFLREKTREALANGVDPAEIQRIAEGAQERLGTFERLNLFVHGQPTITDVTQKEINEFYAQLRRRQLETIRDQLGDIEVQTAENSSTSGFGAEYEALSDDFLDRFAEDPNGLADEAQAFIDAVTDPALRARLDQMFQDFQTNTKEAAARLKATLAAADQLADPDRQITTNELRAAVNEGSARPAALIDRLKGDIQRLDLLIADVRAAKAAADPEEQAEIVKQLAGFLEQRDTLLEEIEDLTQKSITAPADLRIKIRSALNLPDADQANLVELQQIITELEGLNPEEQLERVFQGIEILSKMADAAGQTSFKIPPQFRRILAIAQLPALVDSAAGEQLARAIGISTQVLADRLGEAINQVGLDANKISEAVIAARRAVLIRARQAAYLIENARVRASQLSGIAEDLAALDDLQSQVNAFVESSAGALEVPEVGYTSSEAEDPNDLARRIAEANLAIARANANGDPVRLAQLAKQAADVQYRYAKDQAEKLQAIAAGIEADNQLRDALADIDAARRDLLAAQFANNALGAAFVQVVSAKAAVAGAKGEAARLRAQAEKVNADRAIQDAIRDVFSAQQELLIAIANAAGDTVQAATLQLAQARKNLQALAKGGAGQAELDRARAEVVNAQAAVRDARFQDQLGDIEFLLEMERISVGQAIQMLQRLAEIPGATEEMIRSIERRIKQLRDEVNGDLNFNIPDINLPTLYEVRRLAQSGSPAGTGGYQDNRVTTFGNIIISSDVDAQAFLADLGEVVGAPPTTGNYPGLY